MFDNRRAGRSNSSRQPPRRIQIHQIVVRNFFALNCFAAAKPSAARPRRNIQRRMLMRIFAVSHMLAFAQRNMQPLRQITSRRSSNFLSLAASRSSSIAISPSYRDVAANTFRASSAPCCRSTSPDAFNLLRHARIIPGIVTITTHLENFSPPNATSPARRYQYSRSALPLSLPPSRRRLKRIKIHRHQIDRRNAVFVTTA